MSTGVSTFAEPRLVDAPRALSAALANAPGEVGVVMTMGALHAGHRALLRAARARCSTVVVTIFVNPLQFGLGEDRHRYPRTLPADLVMCRAEGADVVFAPSEETMYPTGRPDVTIDPGPLGAMLEGAARPGHFAGVLTVVAKLLHLSGLPAAAFFGEKDYQQLALVRAMVTALDIDTEIVGIPTVRDDDGLAFSSRNRYLSPEGRRAASAIPAALRAGAAVGAQGGPAVLSEARALLADAAAVAVDYLELRSPELSATPASGDARLLVAAIVGDPPTRLIDNVPLSLGPSTALPAGLPLKSR